MQGAEEDHTNLMRRSGEYTLKDLDDAGIQSLEIAVTDADELIENGDESGARLLFLAELAAIRSTARGPWEQRMVGQ